MSDKKTCAPQRGWACVAVLIVAVLGCAIPGSTAAPTTAAPIAPPPTTLLPINAATEEVPTETLPVPSPSETPGMGSIQGLVWHDICEWVGGEMGVGFTPVSPNCVISPAAPDFWVGNQIMDAGEPPFGGVVVQLGSGACPSTGMAEATTDANGLYRFTDLAAGTYCVTLDPLFGDNPSLMIPGYFTVPDYDVGNYIVALDPGVALEGLDFGWTISLVGP